MQMLVMVLAERPPNSQSGPPMTYGVWGEGGGRAATPFGWGRPAGSPLVTWTIWGLRRPVSR